MKTSLLTLLSTTTLLLLPSTTLACLHYVGEIYLSPTAPLLQTAWIVDNGVDVCDAAWGQTRSMAGYDISCIAGYSLTVSADGTEAWYGTPHGDFRWSQGIDRSDLFVTWDNYRFC